MQLSAVFISFSPATASWFRFEHVIFSLPTDGRRRRNLVFVLRGETFLKAKLVFDDASPIRSLTRGDKRLKERTGLAFVPSFNRAIYSRDRAKIFTRRLRRFLRYFPPDIPFVRMLLPITFHYFGPCFLLFESRWAQHHEEIFLLVRRISEKDQVRVYLAILGDTRWNFCRRGRYSIEGRTEVSRYSRLVKTWKAGISSIFDRTFS